MTVAADRQTLEINRSSGTDVDLACLCWDEAVRRLRDVGCRPMLVGGSDRFR